MDDHQAGAARVAAAGDAMMPDDRLIRILARLAADDGTGEAARLCAVCAEITRMTGAGIMLLSGDVPQGSVCTTNEVSTLIEELQYTLGEGPCIDAHRQHAPVVEPDLADPATVRWAEFSRSAVDAGARAVFGFPVSIGDVHLGALNLYRDRPGPLTDDQHADALVVADVAARAIIDDAGRRRARCARSRARGGRQLPLRRPPGSRHGRRAARASPSPTPCCGCGPTPSAAAAPCPTSPPTSSPVGCASTTSTITDAVHRPTDRTIQCRRIYDRVGRGVRRRRRSRWRPA